MQQVLPIETLSCVVPRLSSSPAYKGGLFRSAGLTEKSTVVYVYAVAVVVVLLSFVVLHRQSAT